MHVHGRKRGGDSKRYAPLSPTYPFPPPLRLQIHDVERPSSDQEARMKEDLASWQGEYALDPREQAARDAARVRREEIRQDLVARFGGPAGDGDDVYLFYDDA